MTLKSAMAAGLIVLCSMEAHANLLRNPGFEAIPGPLFGQGIMPSEWVVSNVTPDTYSNDASYGLGPSVNGNFTGVTAFEGLRWVAGWSAAGQERFGQVLTAPLTPGRTYELSGHLHQALRSDLNFPGGYEVYLTETFNSTPASGEFLGTLGSTSANAWAFFSFGFVAPGTADTLPFLQFAPFVDGAGSAYAGLDHVSLTAVPLPGAGFLLLGGVSLVMLRGSQARNRR